MLHGLRYYKGLVSSGIGKDVILTFLSQIVIMLVLLCSNKLLSNILCVEDFGRYNIIRRGSSVISFILLGGLGISLPRYLSLYLAKKCYKNSICIILASWLYILIITVITFAVYCLLYEKAAYLVIGDSDLSFYLLCFLYALSLALNSYIYAYYRGLGQFKQFNVSQIICQLLMLLPFIFPVANLSLIICLWTGLNLAFSITILLIECHRYLNVITPMLSYIQGVKKQLVVIARYSLPRLVGDFFLFAYSAFPVIYIGNKFGLYSASFYSVGVSLVTMVTPIFSFLGVILLPAVSRLFSENRLKDANRIVSKLALGYSAIALMMTVLLFLGMRYLILIFFSEDYINATYIGRVISLSLLPQAMYLLYRNPNDAVSEVPFNTIIVGVSFLILVLGLFRSSSLEQCAYVYLYAAIFQGLTSFLTWFVLIKKRLHGV